MTRLAQVLREAAWLAGAVGFAAIHENKLAVICFMAAIGMTILSMLFGEGDD